MARLGARAERRRTTASPISTLSKTTEVVTSCARGCESCAPQASPHAAAAAVGSGSGSLRSDLRDNALKSFGVDDNYMLEDFLKKALQLEKLYAAAQCVCARRMVGGRAGSSAAMSCTASLTREIACIRKFSRSGHGRRRCTLRSPPAPPPTQDTEENA